MRVTLKKETNCNLTYFLIPVYLYTFNLSIEVSSQPKVLNLDPSATLTLNANGSSNEKGSGAGVILEIPNEVIVEKSLQFEFETMNNQAEYEALLVSLRLAKEARAKYLQFWSDSKLVTS
uniref:RNase H type-1 domain-containing protein n=1 Tax=Glycine max TaxID=3847 RepID=A0A0R0JTJ8_SOYBN